MHCEELLRQTPRERLDPPPLVTGEDLIAMGLSRASCFGQILDAVRDAQLNEEISTKDEAIAVRANGFSTNTELLKEQHVERCGLPSSGPGAVSDYHHVPGIRLDPRAELVAACDPNEELLAKRLRDWGAIRTTTSYEQIAADPEIDAVIIATPNDTHRPIALACIAGRQARDVRKAAGPQFRRVAANVPGRPRQKRAAHDGLYLSLRAVDAVSQAFDRVRGRSGRRGTSAASGFSICPRRAGAGGN